MAREADSGRLPYLGREFQRLAGVCNWAHSEGVIGKLELLCVVPWLRGVRVYPLNARWLGGEGLAVTCVWDALLLPGRGLRADGYNPRQGRLDDT